MTCTLTYGERDRLYYSLFRNGQATQEENTLDGYMMATPENTICLIPGTNPLNDSTTLAWMNLKGPEVIMRVILNIPSL